MNRIFNLFQVIIVLYEYFLLNMYFISLIFFFLLFLAEDNVEFDEALFEDLDGLDIEEE